MSTPAKTERRWTAYRNADGKLCYLMTSDANRGWYYLYDVSGAEPVRLGKERSPVLLEEKYKVEETLTKTDSPKRGKKK